MDDLWGPTKEGGLEAAALSFEDSFSPPAPSELEADSQGSRNGMFLACFAHKSVVLAVSADV